MLKIKLKHSIVVIVLLSICTLLLLLANVRYYSNFTIAIIGANVFLVMLTFSDWKATGSLVYVHYDIEEMEISNVVNKKKNYDRIATVIQVIKDRWIYDKNYRLGRSERELIRLNKLVELCNISANTKSSNIIIVNWRELCKLDYSLNICNKSNAIILLRFLDGDVGVVKCWN